MTIKLGSLAGSRCPSFACKLRFSDANARTTHRTRPQWEEVDFMVGMVERLVLKNSEGEGAVEALVLSVLFPPYKQNSRRGVFCS